MVPAPLTELLPPSKSISSAMTVILPVPLTETLALKSAKVLLVIDTALTADKALSNRVLPVPAD